MARLIARALVVAGVVAVVIYAIALRPITRQGRSPEPASSVVGGRDYPRLANYNGLRDAWQIPFFANDDLVVARRDAN